MKNWIDRITASVARLLVTGSLVVALVPHARAQSNTVTMNVVSATDGAPIGQFRYLINVDNTGTTAQRSPADGCSPASPGYPASCLWTSIAGVPGSSPIYTQGDQADFPLTLPAGRYLVSVLADGYKIDGAHFTVPLPAAAGGVVTVRMQPYALPAATIQAAVFEDVSPVNGAPDVPAEHGLAGFQGKIADSLGDVSTDVFGNPICTEYQRDAGGNVVFDATARPSCRSSVASASASATSS